MKSGRRRARESLNRSGACRNRRLRCWGTLDYFVTTVFNYPTLAECYKVAALDGYNKIQDLDAADRSAATAAKDVSA